MPPQLRACHSARTEVTLIHQQHIYTLKRQVTEDARAVDPAADNQDGHNRIPQHGFKVP